MILRTYRNFLGLDPDERFSLLRSFLERPRENPERPVEVLQALLEAGADVNPKGTNLVAEAYGYHSPGHARILLRHGAKVDGSRSYSVLRSLLRMRASEEDA